MSRSVSQRLMAMVTRTNVLTVALVLGLLGAGLGGCGSSAPPQPGPKIKKDVITKNEAAAIAACKAYAQAQEMYHRTNWNGDGILKYAFTISAPYGLYETSSGLGDVLLLDKTFALAEGDPGTAIPRTGYVFRILTAQGSGSSGGAMSYLTTTPPNVDVNPDSIQCTLGHALSAIPADYGISGRNTFIVNNAGEVYQKDKGRSAHETAYCPNTANGWIPAN